MDIRLDHPEVLSDFETAPLRRVRGWAGFALGLWLLLVAGDWVARFGVFHWHRQWIPSSTSAPTVVSGSETAVAKIVPVPAQTGAGLTAMLALPWVAKRYEEFHPGYSVAVDRFGYRNAPLPEGRAYDIVMMGDSFLLSLGTQDVAQVLSRIGDVGVYNHATRGAGPFLEMRLFLWSGRFKPLPRVVVWNLAARDLAGSLFQRQAVDDWFAGWKDPLIDEIVATRRIQWNRLAPSELHKSWPNTSLAAYVSRQAWSRIKFAVFREWPRDVLGADDPQFGPMLFYRDNLRVLPTLTPEADAPAVVQKVLNVAMRFRERGMALVILLVPEKEQIHARALSAADQKALARGPEMMSAIENGLKGGGVPVVNLMPVFQAATARGVQLYWRDDTHWNDAGIRLAAEELWRVTEPLLK